MAHSVTAIIGPRDTLFAFAMAEHLHSPLQTERGYWLLPLPEHALDGVVGLPVGAAQDGFNYLFTALLRKLEAASRQNWIVYVETEYFGGIGGQGAVAFQDARIVYGPMAADSNCINEALATIGVSVLPPAHDEFATVGLHERRSTESWLPEAPDE